MTEAQLVDNLLKFISGGPSTEEDFNLMAMQIFAYQFENNQPYHQFCLQKATTPRTVQSWQEIPAVPINGYKNLTLSCQPPEKIGRVFMTSGTTKGNVKGKCYHPFLSVYDLSMIINFKSRFMQEREKIRMGVLFPTEEQMPNSSLAHYLALALKEFGMEGSSYFLVKEGLNFEKIFSELTKSETTGEPYALLGASYSFVHLMDEMQKKERSFRLPEGSKILDTGGFKSQSRKMDLDSFYGSLWRKFGVPRSRCTNMYGMTELSTQFYDWGNEICPPVKSGPHWIRTRVVNPLNSIELPEGTPGILLHCDLAHFNCVSSILTEDTGVKTQGGFFLMGRASGAEAKGCSLAVEEFLKSARE